MTLTLTEVAPATKPPVAPTSAPTPTSPAAPQSIDQDNETVAHHFEFTGSGEEYFRIWVVNLLLTIVTLGVYSAWAKVRRLQYFYRNTRLDGDIFDYHGSPKAILKGRILALVLVGAWHFTSGWIAGVVALVLMAIMPWMLARSFRFKLANSSYRGLRFRFHGTVGQAYRMLILFPVILVFTGFFIWSLVTSFSGRPTLGLILLAVFLPLIVFGGAVPLAHYQLKHFQHDNAYFGQAPFFFHGRVVEFFKIYGKAIVMLILGSMAVGVFTALTARLQAYLGSTALGWLFQSLFGLVSAYVMYLFVRPYLESRIQNLVWNNTDLADHHFESSASAKELLAIHASNLAFIVLTLGLYKPFAAVRIARYRIASLALVPSGQLEEFIGDETPDRAGAVGQEAGDFFDIDIAL